MSEQGHESRLVLSIMGTTIHNGPGIRNFSLIERMPITLRVVFNARISKPNAGKSEYFLTNVHDAVNA